MVAWVVGTGGGGCMCGMMIGMSDRRKVSCVQNFAFKILATLVAISMLATYTWCANVGPLLSSSKFVNMSCQWRRRRVPRRVFRSILIFAVRSSCCFNVRPSIM